jgi:hypothetical protein
MNNPFSTPVVLSVVLRGVASTSPMNLLEMQISGPHSKPTE